MSEGISLFKMTCDLTKTTARIFKRKKVEHNVQFDFGYCEGGIYCKNLSNGHSSVISQQELADILVKRIQ